MKQRVLALCVLLCLLPSLAGCDRRSPGVPVTPAADNPPPKAENTYGEDILRALDRLQACELVRPVDGAFLAWGNEAVAPDFAARLADSPDPDGGELFYELFGETLHVLWDRHTGALETDPRIRATGAGPGGPVTLAFAGDVNLADDWENMAVFRERGGRIEGVITAPLLGRMRDADLLLVNNEFCFSDRGSPMPGKRYTFRAATENVALLRDMGVDIVSLANNHVYDYGEEAFLDTLDTLDAAGIPWVGGGRDLGEAMQAQYFHAGGMKIAYVAASRAEKYVLTPGASADRPGVLLCYEEADLLAAVAAARANADWVVAYLHWGTEYETAPEAVQVELGHKLVDAGADIVVGAHPHVLQGFAFYRERPIAYSLGNFWFNVGWMYTALLEVELFAPGVYRLRVQPAVQAWGVSSLLEEEGERLALFGHLEGISLGEVTLDGEGVLSPAQE